MNEEFEQWWASDGWQMDDTIVNMMCAAYLAGTAAQRKRDVEIAMVCARTVPKSIGQQHGRHHSAGCQRVAAAIEREGV